MTTIESKLSETAAQFGGEILKSVCRPGFVVAIVGVVIARAKVGGVFVLESSAVPGLPPEIVLKMVNDIEHLNRVLK